jgi:hypothetical protein
MSSASTSTPQTTRSSTQSAPFSAGDRAQPGSPMTGRAPIAPRTRRLPGSTGIPKRISRPPADQPRRRDVMDVGGGRGGEDEEKLGVAFRQRRRHSARIMGHGPHLPQRHVERRKPRRTAAIPFSSRRAGPSGASVTIRSARSQDRRDAPQRPRPRRAGGLQRRAVDGVGDDLDRADHRALDHPLPARHGGERDHRIDRVQPRDGAASSATTPGPVARMFTRPVKAGSSMSPATSGSGTSARARRKRRVVLGHVAGIASRATVTCPIPAATSAATSSSDRTRPLLQDAPGQRTAWARIAPPASPTGTGPNLIPAAAAWSPRPGSTPRSPPVPAPRYRDPRARGCARSAPR